MTETQKSFFFYNEVKCDTCRRKSCNNPNAEAPVPYVFQPLKGRSLKQKLNIRKNNPIAKTIRLYQYLYHILEFKYTKKNRECGDNEEI